METIRFDYLNTFLTVARTHSFSIAAKELKTSQGTVSNHIAAIEEYFETELFKRSANGVDLTDEGITLKETAEQILQQAQEAKAKISAAKHKLAGTIRITASTIPEEHIIPSLIAEFKKKHPDVRFKIKAEDSLSSLNSLQANNADFAAVGTIRGFEEKFDYTEVGEEHLVLVVACNHELANRKTVKLAETTKYPFISREETSGTRKEIEKLMETSAIPLSSLKTVFELGSTESVITAVSEGRGVSVISSIAAKKASAAGLVKIINIQEAKNARKLYIARQKKPLLKHAENFWGYCREYRFKNGAISCSSA